MKDLVSTWAGSSVVAIGAHPDDAEIGAGGTLARLSQAGAKVALVAACVPDRLEQRLGEADEAAGALGARSIVLNRSACKRLEDLRTYELVAQLDALVRELKPAVLFAHAAGETHWDHELLHRAVLATTRLYPMDVLFFGTSFRSPVVAWQPRLFVDVTETLDRKLAAIAAHRSQFAERNVGLERFREEARLRGRLVGLPFAEAFEPVRLVG